MHIHVEVQMLNNVLAILDIAKQTTRYKVNKRCSLTVDRSTFHFNLCLIHHICQSVTVDQYLMK